MSSNNKMRGFWTLGFGIMLAIGASSSMASFAEARGGGSRGGFNGGGFNGGGFRGGNRMFVQGARRSFPVNNNRRFVVHNDRRFVRRHYRHFGPGGYLVDGADGVGAGLSITLLNPQETQQTVAYTLDSTADSLDPDQSTVYDGGPRLITFDRGGNFGQAQYTLQPGTYRFTGSDHGWELVSVATPAE